jgi:hypothetical protein
MWLDAVVTSADLQKVVAQVTPIAVPLGSRGHLFFDTPAEVSLVADRGLRIRCHAKLLWPVLGIEVGITISSMTVLIVPAIEERNGHRVIVFTPEVEALDLALLPEIGDTELRAFINRELQEKRVELPWKYNETLDHQFELPDWFRAGATFDIRSKGAAVKITNDSIGLAIGLSASIGPNGKTTDLQPPVQRQANGNGTHNGTHRNGANGAWARAHETSKNGALTGAGENRSNDLQRQRRRQRLLGLGVAIGAGFGIGCLVGMRQAGR